jgi:TDG/mug DNA glycosylase family protein
LGQGKLPVSLGAQAAAIGGVPLFVVPNPSPANAHFTPAQQVEWYDHLAAYRDGLQRSLP